VRAASSARTQCTGVRPSTARKAWQFFLDHVISSLDDAKARRYDGRTFCSCGWRSVGHRMTCAANALLHGGEEAVLGDAGYQGVGKRPENADKVIDWHTAMRPSMRQAL
jgi:hypothetical protein